MKLSIMQSSELSKIFLSLNLIWMFHESQLPLLSKWAFLDCSHRNYPKSGSLAAVARMYFSVSAGAIEILTWSWGFFTVSILCNRTPKYSPTPGPRDSGALQSDSHGSWWWQSSSLCNTGSNRPCSWCEWWEPSISAAALWDCSLWKPGSGGAGRKSGSCG